MGDSIFDGFVKQMNESMSPKEKKVAEARAEAFAKDKSPEELAKSLETGEVGVHALSNEEKSHLVDDVLITSGKVINKVFAVDETSPMEAICVAKLLVRLAMVKLVSEVPSGVENIQLQMLVQKNIHSLSKEIADQAFIQVMAEAAKEADE